MSIKPIMKFVAVGLVATVGLSVVPSPAMAAGDSFVAAGRRVAKGPLASSAEARLARLDTTALAAQAAATGTGSENKPFFKTTKGVVSLILVAAATAWLVQSRIDNKVSSPAGK